MALIKPLTDYQPADGRERIYIKKTFGEDEYMVPYVKGTPGISKETMSELDEADPIAMSMRYCPPLNPHTYEAGPGIICEQDQTCILRDGTKIYADIYRPNNSTERVPCIISWGFFGKRPGESTDEWKLMGVPPQTVSRMAKFEASDPGYWCRYGYAVANVDPRGVGNSEGNLNLWGMDDAYDGYDFIEWVAAQDWCNGKVTMMGNSGVCMVHWKIASTQPPHLACLAAWEGQTDLYRESFYCGGIPNPGYEANIIRTVAAQNYIEDTVSMAYMYPLMNSYWQDKQVKWERIRIPTYVTAGLVHHHLRGATNGFRRIRSAKKWLRMHRDFEWPDTYRTENMEELRHFYDRYLKDINNGWEFTPRVRIDVMDAYDFDFSPRQAEETFPIKRTQYKKLYLNAAGMDGGYEPYAAESEVSYDPKTETTQFDIRFSEETQIIGYMKLHLWVECRGYDNMDLFPWVIKLGQNKEFLPIECMGGHYRGAWGFLRCTHRDLDERLASDFQPVHSHAREERMKKGEIIPVDIEMYPHSRMWHKGEYLSIRLAGRFIKTDWFEDGGMNHEADNGDGIHVIHTGGKYDSYLQIPVVGPKYQSGDYIYWG